MSGSERGLQGLPYRATPASPAGDAAANPAAVRRAPWLLVSLLTATLVYLADARSGSELSLSFFYLLPVAIATWKLGTRFGLLLSSLCTCGWVAAYLETGQFYSHPSILWWNSGVELAVFVTVTLSLARVQRGFEAERALRRRLHETVSELDREMKSVGALQRSLLPQTPPAFPGWQFAIEYLTSTRAGGDYYDFLPLGDGRLGIMVADASGHGSPAAVVMAMTRILVHSAPTLNAAPGCVLARLDSALLENTPAAQFVTACWAALDPKSGRVDYALAGHNPPFVVRADTGNVEDLSTTAGPPLGIVAGATFEANALTLGLGDLLVLYTDGLTEAIDARGDFFGSERVEELVSACRDAEPETIRDRLVQAVARHSGRATPADDLTILIVKRVAA